VPILAGFFKRFDKVFAIHVAIYVVMHITAIEQEAIDY